VTDDGVKELAALTNLTTLDLSGTRVADEGVKALTALTNLTELNLFATKVTDAGLKHLAALKKLTVLNVYGASSRVTDEGVKELQKALPKCKIVK
jgi:hypothetical protein